jgi:hypothetical protein
MAAATAVVSRRGNDQFRGLFTDTWDVSCTLDTASIGTLATTTDTVTVAGVALGDMVIGMSVGVSEAGLMRRAYVSAANTVTIVSVNPTGTSVNLDSTTLQLIIGRPVN